LLTEQLTLLLKVFCLLLELVFFRFLLLRPFLPLAMELFQFRRKFPPHSLTHGLAFGFQCLIHLLHTLGMLTLQLLDTLGKASPFLIERVALPLHGFAFASQFVVDGVMKSLAFSIQFFAILFDNFALLVQFRLKMLQVFLSFLKLRRHLALSCTVARHLFCKLTSSRFEGTSVGAKLAAFGDKFGLPRLQLGKSLLQGFRRGAGLQQDF
jgi:hypothetical protein